MGHKRDRNKILLPDNVSNTYLPSSAQSTHILYTSGPLPAPEVLERYARILPGLEKTIVEQSVKQSSHRMNIEKSRERQSYYGQLFAFILALFMVSAGFVAMFLHYPLLAGSIFTTSIIAVTGLFLGGKYQATKNK